MGRAKAIALKRARHWLDAQGTGGRATRQGIAARGGRCRRRITPGLRRAQGKGLAPWSGHGPRCYRQSTVDALRPESQALADVRDATVKITTRRACVLVRDAPGPPAGPCQRRCQCPAAGLPLQSQKLPIGKSRVAIDVICRGVGVAMFYLWVRADLGGGRRARIGCHGSRSPRRIPRPPPATTERRWHCRATRITPACHWR
jgi:hypothetical protein